MRTRRSNRVKSYVAQTYDLGEGSEAEEVPERLKGFQDNEAGDEDFAVSEGGASPVGDQENDEDESRNEEDEDDKDLVLSSNSDTSTSELEDLHTYLRYRHHGSKGERPAWLREPGQYLSINPSPTDTHVPRGYAGYFDRNVRGVGLVRALYGPDLQRLKVAAGFLGRWIDWSLLPPRELAPKPNQARGGLWSNDTFRKERAFAERWLRRVHTEQPRRLTFSSVSFEEAQLYSMKPSSLPVMVGPSGSQVEITISVGQSIPLSDSGLPFRSDDGQSKGPTGWMLDVGGLAVSLDWVPRRSTEIQLLAMAILPFSDQSDPSEGQKAAEPESQSHGIIQIWEFASVKGGENTYLPSASPPKVRKTIFTDQGRVRRIRWNPACNHLAILSSIGVVWVADFDDDDFSGAEYGESHESVGAGSLANSLQRDSTTHWLL